MELEAQHSWPVMEKPRAGEVRELNDVLGGVHCGRRGRRLGTVEGQSYATLKFSAACGLRRAVTMKSTDAGLHPSQVRSLLGCELCPPDCTPDQLGLENEAILNVELKQGRAVSTGSSAWLLHGWRAGAAAGCLDVAVLASRSL